MRRPDQYYAVPYASYVDGLGPSIVAEFLNLTQEGLADIVGGLWCKSATLIADEFDEITFPAGKLGRFNLIAPVNTTAAMVNPTGASQHGLWKLSATAAAVTNCTALTAASWVHTFDLTFSGSVAITARGSLNVVGGALPGMAYGLFDSVVAPNGRIFFGAGSDNANWHFYVGVTVINTGVPIADGTFYALQICRRAGTIYGFINGALVATVAFPAALPSTSRFVYLDMPGPAVGDGIILDYHRVWYQR